MEKVRIPRPMRIIQAGPLGMEAVLGIGTVRIVPWPR
jgi:hypothetical protein